jgi:hypothetical protein
MLRKNAAKALGHANDERNGQDASDKCSPDKPLFLRS